MRNSTCVLLVLIAGLIGAVSYAEESPSPRSFAAPETIIKPWLDAVEKYEKARSTATAALVRLFDTAEEKARATGDLDKVKSLKRERAEFLEAGKLPASLKTTAYEKSMDTARSTLRTAAQKAKTLLLKQKFDDDAAAIEEQLTDLLKSVRSVSEPRGKSEPPAAVAAPQDGRVYWKQVGQLANEYRMIVPGEWVSTTHNGQRIRHFWKEMHRTPEYVELYDKSRKYGMRLREASGDVTYNYVESGPNEGFGGWGTGSWVFDPTDVIYLSDLPAKSYKVLHLGDRKDFGLGKQGRMTQFDNELIFLDNRPSPHGLFTHPSANDFAMVKYDISKLKRQVFRAKYGIADLRGMNPKSSLTFVVLGDGKRLFTSEPIQEWGKAHDCEVNVRNVKELELRVECPGDAELALAVWYEPRLSQE